MPSGEAAPNGRRLGPALAAVVVPVFVAVGAPSVALPSIARALGVPFGATAWVLAAWALTAALAMPLTGRLMARWGPVRVLVAGVAGLTAGSALAAVGPTLPVVVVGRLVGGAGAGATVIAVFAVVTALPGRERARALGIIAGATATASACGTLLGGAVTAWLGWRAVLAVPVLALPLLPAAAVAARGAGRDGPPERLDLVGAAALSVLAGSLITLLQARPVGLSPAVVLAVAAAGALAAAALWWRVRRAPDGFVPRRVVAARGLPAAGLVGGAVFAGYFGVLFLAPSLLERATGGGPLAAGALLVPAAACSVPAGRLAVAGTDRFGAWRVAAALSALTAAGVLVVAVLAGPLAVVVGVALTVCGFAGAQAVLVGLVPALVAPPDRTTGQGLLNFMINIGGGIGPAAVAGLSGVVPVPVALGGLAALPLAGVVLSLTRRPGAVRTHEEKEEIHRDR